MNGEQRAKPATRNHTFDFVKEKQLTSKHVPCHSDVCQHNPISGLKNILNTSYENLRVLFGFAFEVHTICISEKELDKHLNPGLLVSAI
jgi:hypothetical protein